MVLDDASPQSPTMDSPDTNPFVPQNAEFPIPKYHPRQVRPETVTRPNAIYMILYGGTSIWRKKVNFEINHRIGSMQSIAARHLSQEEVDAVVTHSSRKVYRERLGIPLAFAATYIAMNRTLRNWTPWKMHYHREGKWVHPVAGAKAVWEIVRYDTAVAKELAVMVVRKTFFWGLIGWTACSIYAGLMEAVGLRSDSRLFGYMEETKNQDPEVKRKRLMDAYKREKFEMAREAKAKRKEGQTGGDELGQQEQQLQQQQQEQEVASVPVSAPTSWSPSPSSRSQPMPEQPQSGDFFDDQDDASPTAPEYRAAERRKQGGSVWDQIRQQNMSGSSDQGQRQNTWERASGSDSGSSMKPDWGRQRERSQSQAEFDKLIESERNASTDSFSGGKPW